MQAEASAAVGPSPRRAATRATLSRKRERVYTLGRACCIRFRHSEEACHPEAQAHRAGPQHIRRGPKDLAADTTNLGAVAVTVAEASAAVGGPHPAALTRVRPSPASGRGFIHPAQACCTPCRRREEACHPEAQARRTYPQHTLRGPKDPAADTYKVGRGSGDGCLGRDSFTRPLHPPRRSVVIKHGGRGDRLISAPSPHAGTTASPARELDESGGDRDGCSARAAVKMSRTAHAGTPGIR
jgi:hypothetical protein